MIPPHQAPHALRVHLLYKPTTIYNEDYLNILSSILEVYLATLSHLKAFLVTLVCSAVLEAPRPLSNLQPTKPHCLVSGLSPHSGYSNINTKHDGVS